MSRLLHVLLFSDGLRYEPEKGGGRGYGRPAGSDCEPIPPTLNAPARTGYCANFALLCLS